MTITILYFGMLAEITGQASETWPVKEGLTVGDLKREIGEKYPLIREKKFKVAVNQQIGDDLMKVSVPSEVAFLPPFAGG
jgi:molybdopterin synthase sulfur carrier subunit